MTESYTSIFVLGGAIAVAIILMSVFFIVKAVRRAKQIGMDKKIVKDTIPPSFPSYRASRSSSASVF